MKKKWVVIEVKRGKEKVVSSIISKKIKVIGVNSGVSNVVSLKNVGYDGYVFVEVERSDRVFDLFRDISSIRGLVKFDNVVGVLEEYEVKRLGLVS